MGIIGGKLGYSILKRMSCTGETGYMDGSVYANKSKLEILLGVDFWRDIENKVVIDFDCGEGHEALEMAQHGARKVIGLDIQEQFLQAARQNAARTGLNDQCEFTTTPREKADVIVSLDAFEHFDDPPAILKTMRGLLRDDGCVIASFGPTWYHPLGGHAVSVFPFAHLIFTEHALMRWRNDHKKDGFTRFSDGAGGLNKMTLARFEHIVEKSPFRFAAFEAVPIRKLKPIANKLTREFTTAVVRCKLVPQ